MGTDPKAIEHFWADLEPGVAPRLRKAQALIDNLVSTSPFLRSLMMGQPEVAAVFLEQDPQESLATICKSTDNSAFLDDVSETAKILRLARKEAALLLALCDTGNVWDVVEVTQGLSTFADAAVRAAVNALLREAHAGGKLHLPDVNDPAAGCGYVVLAMGKHGAHELNYSSDIDLIVLFDPAATVVKEDHDPGTVFIRMTKRLVALLQDLDADGHVFRTDLRLRPDPRATQVAISIEAAAHYYENLGQNWERAAYIKARPVAGDLALGAEFLDRLKPYIWRKYLDFAAIADVQSLIRQIHAVKGHGVIAVEGHNLKLGRGGIREIEFFVQTQQLIAGGRNAALRGRSTLAMLEELATAQWITAEAASDLQHCYVFLRKLEHRAQMVDDQQTHLVPKAPEAFANYAALCGYAGGEALARDLRHTLETVQKHSSRLFESADTLGGASGSLVFTGGEDDPDTLETLAGMGFRQASEVSATIRGWHFGRYAATRTRRARRDLTELMPVLLKALAQDGDADTAFLAFDRFLSKLPTGVQLFAMLKAKPALLDLLARILSMAPRLAEGLSRRPRVLEAVLEPGFFEFVPGRAQLEAATESIFAPGVSLEESMDRARVLGREQQFRVGVRVLSNTVSAEDAGEAFASIADVLIGQLLRAVEADMAAKHGIVEGARIAIIAMGKLGGREMTAGSDLDLILVYDHAEDVLQSDGQRPLAAGSYFQRLTQRFISALTAPTAEGALYDVDMRLRPSGSKGPMAVHFESFKTYHAGNAWTWEKLALTRARVVAGDVTLTAEVESAVSEFLSEPRDVVQIRKDVVEMRSLMLREHKPTSPWDIKRVRGGLVELEFIAQFLQLIHASARPEVLDSNTMFAFEALAKANLLDPETARLLLEAAHLYHRITQVLRLCVEGIYDPTTAMPGLNRAIASATGLPDVGIAESLIREHQEAAAEIFDELVGQPSAN